jgi:ribosome recycling factor
MIVVKPYDTSILKDIERAIRNSDVGITPSSDGKVLRLPVPPLSGDRRHQIVNQVRKMAEAQRVAIRNARRDANKQIDTEKKAGTLSEDDADRCKENIQEFTKNYEKQIEEISEAKTKDIQQT